MTRMRQVGAAALILLPCTWLEAAHTTYWEKDGIVSMETENADTKGKWKEEDPADGSSGKYLTATGRRSRTDAIEFHVTFTSIGWFRVWLRCRSTSDADNDCFVMLDGEVGSVPVGKEWKTVAGIKTNHTTWGWDSQAKEEGMPLSERLKGCHVFVASPGAHMLALGSRSKDFKIDKVVVLHISRPDAAEHPKDTGPPETFTFPHFPDEAAHGSLADIRKAVSNGLVGKSLTTLDALSASAEGEERKQALDTREAIDVWLNKKRETIAVMRKEGRVVAAYVEADLLAAAFAGCNKQKEAKILRSEIKSAREFGIGTRFYQMLKSLTGTKKEQRNTALARFAASCPNTFYAKLARSLIDE